MKILLISDTHGYLDSALIKHIKSADEIWHAGDIGDEAVCAEIHKYKPLRAVFGNIDGQVLRQKYPEVLSFDSEGLKVVITHIGGYPGHFPANIKKLITSHGARLFICGHSHILRVMYDKELEVLCMNPGAAGIHGFHQVKTALRFEIDKGEIKNLAVIELGKRNN